MHYKVIITGKNGYIGNKIREKLTESSDSYEVKMLSLRDESWKGLDFTGIDVVIHTAGIVHSPHIRDWNSYKKVNVDLTEELAKKAKEEGVSTFVFFSSMAVYGVNKTLSRNYITNETKLRPTTMYGKSKLLAERVLVDMMGNDFHVIIIRPPIVYGQGCSGNYFGKLSTMVKYLPVIPDAFKEARQGFVYIDNLTELVKLAIDSGASRKYMPQDEKPICATELLVTLADAQKVKKKTSKVFGAFVRLLWWTPIVKKVFGGVAYDDDISSCFQGAYRVVNPIDGLRKM